MKALASKYWKPFTLGFLVVFGLMMTSVGLWWLFGPFAIWSQTEIAKLEIAKETELRQACLGSGGQYVYQNGNSPDKYKCEWKDE